MQDNTPKAIALDFEDFDHLCQELSGWSLEFCQLDSGPFRGRFAQVATARTLLIGGRLGRHLEQRGDPPPHGVTIGIPAPDCAPFSWRREPVSPGDLLVLGPGAEMDAISRDGFSIYTFSASPEHFALAAEGIGLRLPRSLLETGVRRGPMARAGELARMLAQLLERASRRTGSHEAPGLEHQLDQEATLEILRWLSEAEGPAPADGLSTRREIYERARAHIAASAKEAITVDGLSAVTGTSVRTLRRAFQENCGVPPKTYLQAQRLGGVHRILLRSRPRTTTVAEAGDRFGFWHMGQFAADYRRQFGELPSQTLARRGA